MALERAGRQAVSAAARGPAGPAARPAARRVLERRGRFLVAEPLFGSGPRTAGRARRGGRGRPGAGRRGQARRARRAPARPAGRRPRRARGPDARPRPAPHVRRAPLARRRPRRRTRYAADARVDLTDLPTFTIDPDDAQDFDDAISAAARTAASGSGSTSPTSPPTCVPAGRSSARRGTAATSVYVPGAVEPMLPEALSNEACSLRPGEEKLAVTVEMEMDGTDVRKVAFHRSRVRSDARLTYGEVDEVFAGSARAEEPWAEPLEAAREVARALAARARVGRDRQRRAGLRVRLRRPRDAACTTRSRPSRTA